MKKGKVKVVSKKDYIVEVEGLYPFILNQMVSFASGARGIVVEAKGKRASVALLEDTISLQVVAGGVATMEREEFSIPINKNIMGSVVNVYGDIVYGSEPGPISRETYPVFRMARTIYTRDFVNKPLITGLASVDWAIPIGKGQRELLLGDRKTGKTSMALNMIIAQRETNVKCVYVAIGQKKSTIIDIHNKIVKYGMGSRTVIVSAPADDTATRKYLAPYTGATISEYLQEKFGDDVLIIYDDLSKHADAYREISLLLRTAPAREAYPGDVFYLHSKLLERAGSFKAEFGGGSITAIPIIQTEAGDITSYIPTNVISISDGQIFTSKKMFNAGLRPAVDIAYSVSRVGSVAQTPAMKKYSGGLKLAVSQFNEIMKIAKLSPQAASENKEVIAQGNVLNALFRQGDLEVIRYEAGILILTLFKKGLLNFYTSDKEIIEIKKIINIFVKEDIVGRKLGNLLVNKVFEEQKIELIIKEIILPIVKYHLITTFPALRENPKFVELYGKVRDDSRIYNAIKKNMDKFKKNDEMGEVKAHGAFIKNIHAKEEETLEESSEEQNLSNPKVKETEVEEAEEEEKEIFEPRVSESMFKRDDEKRAKVKAEPKVKPEVEKKLNASNGSNIAAVNSIKEIAAAIDAEQSLSIDTKEEIESELEMAAKKSRKKVEDDDESQGLTKEYDNFKGGK